MLDDIEIDPMTWQSAPEARRAEWRMATLELLEGHAFGRGQPRRAQVLLDEGAVYLRWFDASGQIFATSTLERARLAAHLDEYVAICRRMGALEQGASSAELEALDMAKKLAHDASARALRALLPEVDPDHSTSRRLFTLVLTLFVDTTRLSMVHAHRRPFARRPV